MIHCDLCWGCLPVFSPQRLGRHQNQLVFNVLQENCCHLLHSTPPWLDLGFKVHGWPLGRVLLVLLQEYCARNTWHVLAQLHGMQQSKALALAHEALCSHRATVAPALALASTSMCRPKVGGNQTIPCCMHTWRTIWRTCHIL